jgi:hypothetical protein
VFKPTTIASAGRIAMTDNKIDPGKVILLKTVSKNSAVGPPGLIPGIKPPLRFKSSDMLVVFTCIAV